MAYICTSCDKEFKSRQNLNYHISHGACKILSYHCKYCGKGFTASSNMYVHMKDSCKIKKQDDDEKAQIYERLLKLEENNRDIKKENEKLKKKVVSLEKNAKVTKNITHNKVVNNNINNGIVAHINLIGYGKEDLSIIDKKDIIKAIQQGYNSTIKLTETLHFNPKHPEYHNVYITNMKDKYAMMFDGKEWNLTMKDDLINKIYDDKKTYIEENIDEFIDSLSASRKKALDRWLETDDDDERISKIKNEIKLLLYNKRNLITDKQEDPIITVKKVKQSTKTTKKPSLRSRKDSSSDEE